MNVVYVQISLSQNIFGANYETLQSHFHLMMFLNISESTPCLYFHYF